MNYLPRDLDPAIDAGQAQLLGAERSFFQNAPLFGSQLSRIFSACTLTLPEMGLRHLKEGLQSGCLKNRVGHIIYGTLCFLPLVSGIAWMIWILSPRHEQPSGDQAREAASTELALGNVEMEIGGKSPQHEDSFGDPLLYATEVAVGDGGLSPEDVAGETSSTNSSEEVAARFIAKYRLATARDSEPWPAADAKRRDFTPIETFPLSTGTISIVYDKDYLAIGANAIVSPDDRLIRARSGAAQAVHDGATDHGSNANSPFLQELRDHLGATDAGVLHTGAALFHRVEASSPLAKSGTGFVIHAVGPVKFDASDKKIKLLKETYKEAFLAAAAANWSLPEHEQSDDFSVAVCLITTGRFDSQAVDEKKMREASFLTCLQAAQEALDFCEGWLVNIHIYLYENAVGHEECQVLCGLAQQELGIYP